MKTDEFNSPANIFFRRIAENLDTDGKLSTPEEGTALPEIWRQFTTTFDIDDWELAAKVSKAAGKQVARDLENPMAELVAKVPYDIASSYQFLPLGKDGTTIMIAVSNPFDESMDELISFIFGINTRLQIAPPGDLDVAIAAAYEKQSGEGKRGEVQLDGISGISSNSVLDRQIPKLARQLMVKALEKGASDLHVQDFVGGSAVRIRVDGLLQRLVILPNSVANGLIRYCKALGNMDPTSKMRPQDGRVSVKLKEKEFDLRLSVIPTRGGQEKLVIRFLSRSQIFNLTTKNFSLEEIHTLRRLAASPSGVILICGPTGSGKTTTLYSILSELNDEQVSISTVENPVEYNMAGLAQTEVNEKAGMTFASALRSILRQDPDIILIGEIRDEETAQIAMQSALTGHLVFSTLHTNDALSAIPRLRDLGVPSAILNEALVGLVSQRLLRRLCNECKQPVEGSLNQIEEGFRAVTHVKPSTRANGCKACNYTGYAGRVVVSEMVEIDSALRKLIQAGEADVEKLHHSVEGHGQNLSVSASRLIISGETTAEEAVRVIGRHFWIELAEEYKSDLPKLSILNISGDQLLSEVRPEVLLAGPADTFDESFKEELKAAWFDLHQTKTPEEAKLCLTDNEEVDFVVVDLDETLDDDGILTYVANYREKLAWSRLPALIRLPEGREELQEKLVADGATSRFISKSAPASEVIALINAALAENLGFSWGKQSDSRA